MPCPICGNDGPNCDCTPEERRMHADAEELLDRVATLEAAVPRWIPVGERLPEQYEIVMIGWAGRRGIGKGYLHDGKWHDPLLCQPDVNQPTHWMPLPAPPKGGEAVSDEPRHRPITVTILDTHTGQTTTNSDYTPWYWAYGNGSCDCNRGRDDLYGVCLGSTRYYIVAVEGDESGYTLDEYNREYPARRLVRPGGSQ